MKNRHIYWGRYKIQETLYIGQWHLCPLQIRHLGTSHGSPNYHQIPQHIFLNLINSLKSLTFKRWFKFREKAEVTGGWLNVFPKNSAWDVMHERGHCGDKAANHQLPIAAAFWIIPIVSVEDCSSLMQNLMQICGSTHSIILNVMATQYTCSPNVSTAPTD